MILLYEVGWVDNIFVVCFAWVENSLCLKLCFVFDL